MSTEKYKIPADYPYKFRIGSIVRCKEGFTTDNTEDNFAGHGYKSGKTFVIVGRDVIYIKYSGDSYAIYYPENEPPIIEDALDIIAVYRESEL